MSTPPLPLLLHILTLALTLFVSPVFAAEPSLETRLRPCRPAVLWSEQFTDKTGAVQHRIVTAPLAGGEAQILVDGIDPDKPSAYFTTGLATRSPSREYIWTQTNKSRLQRHRISASTAMHWHDSKVLPFNTYNLVLDPRPEKNVCYFIIADRTVPGGQPKPEWSIHRASSRFPKRSDLAHTRLITIHAGPSTGAAGLAFDDRSRPARLYWFRHNITSRRSELWRAALDGPEALKPEPVPLDVPLKTVSHALVDRRTHRLYWTEHQGTYARIRTIALARLDPARVTPVTDLLNRNSDICPKLTRPEGLTLHRTLRGTRLYWAERFLKGSIGVGGPGAIRSVALTSSGLTASKPEVTKVPIPYINHGGLSALAIHDPWSWLPFRSVR